MTTAPDQREPSRWWLVVAYSGMSLGGIIASIWASPAVSLAGQIWALTWAMFLAIGGVVCAAGQLWRVWLGEYIGCPMLASAYLVYAVSVANNSIINHRYAGFALSCVLVGFASAAGYRWRWAAQHRDAARQIASHGRSDHER